jgi:hypothetical protein
MRRDVPRGHMPSPDICNSARFNPVTYVHCVGSWQADEEFPSHPESLRRIDAASTVAALARKAALPQPRIDIDHPAMCPEGHQCAGPKSHTSVCCKPHSSNVSALWSCLTCSVVSAGRHPPALQDVETRSDSGTGLHRQMQGLDGHSMTDVRGTQSQSSSSSTRGEDAAAGRQHPCKRWWSSGLLRLHR